MRQLSIPALRAALQDYRHLSPLMAGVDDEVRPLLELEQEVALLWDAYQSSRYGALARRLPQLIDDCLSAARIYNGDQQQRANALSGYAHQVATLFLTKLGETDLAWIAASRGLAAANASGDSIVIGSLSRAAAHALTANGDYPQARRVASAAAEYLQPELGAATPQLLSIYGSLHLMCALAAARADDRQGATTHLAEAADTAQRQGEDANHVWTAFGPTNVAIHQTCVALEFGDIQRAIQIGPTLDTRGLPIERQVRHAIEVARAYLRYNRIDDAVDTLLSAEQISSDHVLISILIMHWSPSYYALIT